MTNASEKSNKSNLFEIGKKYFVRTVTHYHLGLLVNENEMFLSFKSCSWVADTKRFHIFLENGVVDDSPEIETFPENSIVHVNKGAIIDIVEWQHQLPIVSQ